MFKCACVQMKSEKGHSKLEAIVLSEWLRVPCKTLVKKRWGCALLCKNAAVLCVNHHERLYNIELACLKKEERKKKKKETHFARLRTPGLVLW